MILYMNKAELGWGDLIFGYCNGVMNGTEWTIYEKWMITTWLVLHFAVPFHQSSISINKDKRNSKLEIRNITEVSALMVKRKGSSSRRYFRQDVKKSIKCEVSGVSVLQQKEHVHEKNTHPPNHFLQYSLINLWWYHPRQNYTCFISHV